MTRNFKIYTALLAMVLTACSPSDSTSNDPFRTEYLAACENQSFYKRKPVDKVQKYCRCVYDKTLRGLSDDEKMAARFYLMAQSGIDVQNREEFTSIDPVVAADSMVPASNAIGEAVKACGRP